MNSNRFRFRQPIICTQCKFKSFQYWFYNGQSFMEDGYKKCNCSSPSFTINGIIEQCTGYSAIKSYRGVLFNDLLIYEHDIIDTNLDGIIPHKRMIEFIDNKFTLKYLKGDLDYHIRYGNYDDLSQWISNRWSIIGVKND